MRYLRPHHSPLHLPPHRRHLRHLRSTTTAATMQSSQASSSTAESQQALTYHNRTKHSLTAGYARGPRNLDWANQPNPFLRFPSAPLLPLPHPPLSPSPPYLSLFSAAAVASPAPISVASLTCLLFDSLSLSAWKSTGLSTWSLRVNPSSGNLHPTEAHVLSPAIPSLNPNPSPFLAHYSPKDHSLELRALLPHPLPLPSSCLLLSLSSIFWREAWKYGERALRYCNHDVGHAIAAVTISAAALGWDARLLDGLGHTDIDALLGINHADTQTPPDRARGRFPLVEAQHPDCVLVLFPAGDPPAIDYPALTAAISSVQWLEGGGVTNSLSKDHVYWDVIYRTADAVRKPRTDTQFTVNPLHPSKLISEGLYKELTVRELVRKRRSAVDMDGVHVMKRDTFYQILLHCLPSGEVGLGERQGKQLAMPFRVLPWDAEVHAVLFVHRVADMPKGLYFLVRNEGHFDSLKQAMRSEFEWERPEGCPEGLPLYRLARGDCQEVAKQLSCHQDIAADGCFSLGMVARFAPVIEKNAWMYPRLFWESGVLGQMLYLEAHAVGISATGIGCYFDDGVHQVLGLKDSEFQSLYHFTVGSPVLDKRIMSLPAYPGPGIDA